MLPQPLAVAARAARALPTFGLSDHDVDDMVQEAAVRVWQVTGRLDPERPGAVTYLHRTAQSAIMGYLRRRARIRELPTDPEWLRPNLEPSAEAEAIAADTRDRILRTFVRAYRAMSPNERARFREVLGGRRRPVANVNTDKTYARRAKTKLEQAAREEGCQQHFDRSSLRRFFRR